MAKFKIIVCKHQDPKTPAGTAKRNWVQYDYKYHKTANVGTVFEVPRSEVREERMRLLTEIEAVHPELLVSFMDLPDH
jgi:hypothetical protein